MTTAAAERQMRQEIKKRRENGLNVDDLVAAVEDDEEGKNGKNNRNNNNRNENKTKKKERKKDEDEKNCERARFLQDLTPVPQFQWLPFPKLYKQYGARTVVDYTESDYLDGSLKF